MDWFRIRHTIGLCFCMTGRKRADYLKKHHVLGAVGKNCMVMFRKVPLYPDLISMGDNVWIASEVSFVTHDVIHRMLNNYGNYGLRENKGAIRIGNNVFVGAHSTLLPGVTIGDNTIIGAGSLVNKSIGNGVYAGVPAKYICSFEDFIEKRKNQE